MDAETILEVVTRATEDKKFAKQLKEEAKRARKAGCGSSEAETLIRHFVASPEELARLTGQAGPGVGATGFSRQAKLIMITTTSGGACIPAITTTTALIGREERE